MSAPSALARDTACAGRALLPAAAAGRAAGHHLLEDVRGRHRPAARGDHQPGGPACLLDDDPLRRNRRTAQHHLRVITALMLVRQDFRGKGMINSLIDLPFAVSPVVIGLALFLVYGVGRLHRRPAGGTPASRSSSPTPGMVLATIFVSLPFVVREVMPVLQEIGNDQEQAARPSAPTAGRRSGRSRCRRSAGASTYGVVLATARALGEFGAVARGLGQDLRPDRDPPPLRRERVRRTSTLPAPTQRRSCSRFSRVLVLFSMNLLRRKPGGRGASTPGRANIVQEKEA